MIEFLNISRFIIVNIFPPAYCVFQLYNNKKRIIIYGMNHHREMAFVLIAVFELLLDRAKGECVFFSGTQSIELFLSMSHHQCVSIDMCNWSKKTIRREHDRCTMSYGYSLTMHSLSNVHSHR